VGGLNVSVVIPAHNASGTLDLQIDALARQDFRGSWEVVVVDNASTDHTAQLVANWIDKLACLRVVTCHELGVNRARNAGVRASVGECVLLCDADDIVSTSWVREMNAALATYDLVGGRLDYTRLNRPRIRGTRGHPSVENLPTTFAGDLPYAIGANMGFRRSVFDAVAGFDESFARGGADEVDFCWQAQYEGFTIGFARGAVVHYRFKDRLRLLARQHYFYALGHAHLYAKHRALGRLPPQSERQRWSLLYEQVKRLAHVERLVKPEHRWLYVRRAAWFAGSLRGLVQHRVVV
jgi:glycosyltransferase involved in cell wall biosynthesis